MACVSSEKPLIVPSRLAASPAWRTRVEAMRRAILAVLSEHGALESRDLVSLIDRAKGRAGERLRGPHLPIAVGPALYHAFQRLERTGAILCQRSHRLCVVGLAADVSPRGGRHGR